MAEKILLELTDKEVMIISSRETSGETKMPFSTLPSDLRQEILQTLTLMGYQSKKVQEMLDWLPDGLETLNTILPYIIKNY